MSSTQTFVDVSKLANALPEYYYVSSTVAWQLAFTGDLEMRYTPRIGAGRDWQVIFWHVDAKLQGMMD